MYEHRSQKPLSIHAFSGRMVRHLASAVLLVTVSLGVGAAGFAHFETMHWPDALLHAATPLSGMGLASVPSSFGGKLFAIAYVLYAGLAFVAASGIVIAPVLHRLLHELHFERALSPSRREGAA